jgi:DNA mismatch repair ATPase MutS
MNEKKNILIKYKTKLENVTSYKFGMTKVLRMGEAMKNFYALYDNEELKQSLQYSFGFNGYIHNLSALNKKLISKEIALCKYNKLKTKFKKSYYPIINNNPVKNSYDLNKKLLITGPNASGKTTILKTTLLNILFSQQIGMGFYSKAYIKPYTYLHCYLNIPDTSCRDSLFQAEARRCKNIITELESSLKVENHFCIFDELYSGTNPYEAISSSVSLLRYITKHQNLDFVLTTHFLDVCKILDNDEKFMNCCMNIIEKDDDFEYTYKLINGISQVKGGVKVLKDLEYPIEIINNTKLLLNSLKI